MKSKHSQNTLDAAEEVCSVAISGEDERVGPVVLFDFVDLQQLDVDRTHGLLDRQPRTKPVEQIFGHFSEFFFQIFVRKTKLSIPGKSRGLTKTAIASRASLTRRTSVTAHRSFTSD